MQVMSVEEALASMTAKRKSNGDVIINRFNKRNFNLLMVALANDVNFTSKVAKIKNGHMVLEDIMPTKGFRKWCKKLVENMGVDKFESERIMTDEFIIDNMEGLYEFFCEAIQLYMEAGNKFDLPNREDFHGGIFISEIPESTKISEARNPQTKESMGMVETKKKKHKKLRVKSGCPSYLSEKRKVDA